jgi:chromate transporter
MSSVHSTTNPVVAAQVPAFQEPYVPVYGHHASPVSGHPESDNISLKAHAAVEMIPDPSPLPTPLPATPSLTPALDAINVPVMTKWEIFKLFLTFGFRAWGGPVAQMAAMKQKFVIDDKWISVARFNRVISVYQALPGPEATELACYFGLLAGGRPGAVLGGLGFLLPGFVMMMCAAALYVQFGQTSPFITQAMGTIQVAVTAMVFRAVHKIGADNIKDHDTPAQQPGAPPPPASFFGAGISTGLVICAALAMVEATMNVNFFITLLHCASLWAVCIKPGRTILAWIWGLVPLIGFLAFVIKNGAPFSELIPLGVGVGAWGNNPGTIFLVGLLGGLLTFGGAYTAIPFMRFETVISGGWLTSQQFLDAIAVGQVLPSPLVMFSCFVGYVSGGFWGGVLMTIGMFLPAFSFTLIGHEFFERIVESKGLVSHLLDGISAAVAGLIAVTAVQLLKSAVDQPVDAVIFMGSLAVLYTSKHKFTNMLLVGAAVLAGFILASPQQ